jgi:glyoxylase I family protein
MIELKKAALDIGIITRNADPMVAFYHQVLGLPLESVIPMPSGGTMHRLKAGNSLIKIVQLDNPPAHSATPGGIPAATGCRYWTLYVSDLAAAVALCEQAGRRIAVPPKTIRAGVSIAMVEDPDGNWLELLESNAV